MQKSSPTSAVTSLEWQPCEECGGLGVDARPEGTIVVLVCPRCGHEEQRVRLPFFSVTGASGAGKSTLVRRLWKELPQCVTLDGDVLWNRRFWPEREAFYNLWLVAAGQISQTGRPAVVCTAAMPNDWDTAPARVFVGDVHILALVCDEQDLLSRLAARERPRDGNAPPDFLEQTRIFNQWLREHLPYIDTSTSDAGETADEVAAWVRSHL